MGSASIAVTRMVSLAAGMLATSTIFACKELPEESAWVYRECSVRWMGTLPTDATTFNVEACWNRGCVSDVRVELAQSDGGVVGVGSYTDCMMTTPGGLPSSCTYTPGPGCVTREIAPGVSVQACAVASSEGTTFDVAFLPGERIAGGRSELRIETSDGATLAEGSANVPDDVIAPDGSCQGAPRFDLEVNRIVDE
jgi:hypothetical protein